MVLPKTTICLPVTEIKLQHDHTHLHEPWGMEGPVDGIGGAFASQPWGALIVIAA
jgi:hypothetical protein